MNPIQLYGIARNRSVDFAITYAIMESNNWRPETDMPSLPRWSKLTADERDTLWQIFEKRDGRKKLTTFERRQKRLRAAFEFFKIAGSRPKVRVLRKKLGLMSIWDNFRCNNDTEDIYALLDTKNVDIRIKVGRILADHEDMAISCRHPYNYLTGEFNEKKSDRPLWERLPLYACSGELEADTMDSIRIQRIATMRKRETECRNHTVTTMWRHSEALEFKRDGGGQAETTFQIRPELAKLVCGLVNRIGSPSRNGGHIHINCKMDRMIGERVFNALRFHLCWMRWLAGSVRRNHSWSQMSSVADTFQNATVKACALTAYTWNRTGTIEMRLWGTSHKPEDWLGRAGLMKAIAEWSEHHSPQQYPINQDTETLAWPSFFQWASRNAPDALVYALTQFRKRARSSVLNPADKEAAIRLMGVFEQSGVTVRGYRRRALVGQSTTNQP